jgi:lipopolysaccharide export LptBFGC system permease protein LptF
MVINFVVLFTLFFLLGAAIDIIVNLDEFDTIAGKKADGGSFFAHIFILLKVAIEFEGPRLFQVFAHLHGVIAIGAMAFTAAAMHKTRELIAIMAVGISLRRISIPFMFVMAGISLLALMNQEYILPKVAPLLLRDHGESGEQVAGSFPVPFTPDQNGTLLLAVSLDPESGELTEPTFLERDESGRMIKQIRAKSATWDVVTNAGWLLEGGLSVELMFDDDTSRASITPPSSIDYYSTELSPHMLTLHRYGQYIDMLGISQLNTMLDSAGAFDAQLLRRHWYSRFASILINLLVMVIVIPLFVTREPVLMSKQAMKCGAISLTILFGSTVVMLMPIAGIPAMVSVFLPVIVLFPVGLLRITAQRT